MPKTVKADVPRVGAPENRKMIEEYVPEAPPKGFKEHWAAFKKHTREGWKNMLESGSWKTPAKVLLVTSIAAGIGAAIAVVINMYAK